MSKKNVLSSKKLAEKNSIISLQRDFWVSWSDIMTNSVAMSATNYPYKLRKANSSQHKKTGTLSKRNPIS